MEVIEYHRKLRAEWEEFVENSNNGTIFHLQKFFDYHPTSRFKHRHLLIKKGNRIRALFPAAEQDSSEGKVLASHPGASYGGLVFSPEMGIKESISAVKALLDFSRKQGFTKIVFTQAPIVYHKVLSNYVDFAVWTSGARYLRRELSAVIAAVHDPLAIFRPEARTAVRKSIKSGITVRESRDYARFYEILKMNLEMRHNVTPTHSLDELIRLARLFPKRIRLFCAYKDAEPIGGVVTFGCNERVVLAFYISHVEEHQRLRPVNLLIFELLKWVYDRGYSHLDLGTFTLREQPDFGLAKFKENFKARGLFRNTLEVEL
jgi:hypothetical protein